MSVKGFFSQEGPFMKYGTLVFDLAYVSVLWVLFSGVGLWIGAVMVVPEDLMASPFSLIFLLIAAIHVGPASTACFYVMSRRQRGVDTYIWQEFWKSYKQNYKQGIALSAILNGALTLLALLVYTELLNMPIFGSTVFILIGIQLLFAIELLFLNVYSFSMLARFEMRVSDFLRIGFFMANKHLPTTLLCGVMVIASAVVCVLYFPILVFVLPGICSYLSAALLEKVFRKYMPDEDKELEETEVEGFSLDEERQAIIDRYTGHSRSFDEEPSITIIKPAEEEAAEITIVQEEEKEDPEENTEEQ